MDIVKIMQANGRKSSDSLLLNTFDITTKGSRQSNKSEKTFVFLNSEPQQISLTLKIEINQQQAHKGDTIEPLIDDEDDDKNNKIVDNEIIKIAINGKIIQENNKLDPDNDKNWRHLIFSSQHQDEKALQNHISLCKKELVYCIKYLKECPSQIFEKIKVSLPEKNSKQYTLLLDLDETLIHRSSQNEYAQYEVMYQNQTISFNIRPYVQQFLRTLSKIYDIFIYTASVKEYAEQIVNIIDPSKQYIKGIMSRRECLKTQKGLYVKDLRVIKNRKLEKTIIVDNLIHSFAYQLDNGVPIIQWIDDFQDQELKYLIPYLIEASTYEDIRQFNIQQLQLKKLGQSLIQQLEMRDQQQNIIFQQYNPAPY